MATPEVYKGIVPNKTNGGLTSLQLALANDMATGNLPFGVNLDFLAAMRTYCHSDPLLPINFKNEGQAYCSANGITYRNGGRDPNDPANIGISVRKTNAPDVARNMSGVMYTILGDDIFLLRKAPDCGPDENRFEQTYVGKKSIVAAGSFAYYGRKVIFGAPAATGSYHGGCCFIAGTKITMSDGTEKNIEDVEIGDQLIGKDNAVNTVKEFIRPVLGERKLVSFNNGIPFITSDHPVYTKDGWKSYDPVATMKKYSVFQNNAVGQLMLGDIIETLNGQGLHIKTMQTFAAPPDLQVYNFKLDGNNTYVANDLIVHNKGSGCTGCAGAAGAAAGGAGCGCGAGG